MPIEHYNGEKQEGAANTIAYENVEVPNSYGAKKCFLIRVEMDVTVPDKVASTDTYSMGMFAVGKFTPTTCDVSQSGAITTKHWVCYSDATPDRMAFLVNGPDQAQGRWEVPRNPQDGKYYFTAAIVGAGNTNAKKVYYRADFETVF